MRPTKKKAKKTADRKPQVKGQTQAEVSQEDDEGDDDVFYIPEVSYYSFFSFLTYSNRNIQWSSHFIDLCVVLEVYNHRVLNVRKVVGSQFVPGLRHGKCFEPTPLN